MRTEGFIGNLVTDFIYAVVSYREGIQFIRTHRLWEGFWRYGWLSRFLLVVAFVVGIKFLLVFVQWIQGASFSSASVAGASMLGLFRDLFSQGYNLLFMGGLKYVILILTEVLVFHFSRRTLRVLMGGDPDASFKAFWAAELRMIQVVFFSWIMELILSVFLSVALGILGLTFLKGGIMVLVPCYFVGFAIVDNFFEMNKLTIQESSRAAWQVPGITLGIGVIAYALFLLPLVGAIIGPILAAVTATLLLFEYEKKGIVNLELALKSKKVVG